jgi:hypothetical protein
MLCHIEKHRICVCLSATRDKQLGIHPRDKAKRLTLKRTVANFAGKPDYLAFPQFAELWKLIDLLGGSLSAYIVFQKIMKLFI